MRADCATAATRAAAALTLPCAPHSRGPACSRSADPCSCTRPASDPCAQGTRRRAGRAAGAAGGGGSDSPRAQLDELYRVAEWAAAGLCDGTVDDDRLDAQSALHRRRHARLIPHASLYRRLRTSDLCGRRPLVATAALAEGGAERGSGMRPRPFPPTETRVNPWVSGARGAPPLGRASPPYRTRTLGPGQRGHAHAWGKCIRARTFAAAHSRRARARRPSAPRAGWRGPSLQLR